MRHPKVCKYFYEFGRCKFGVYCNYDHSTTGSSNKDLLDAMTLKIKTLETEKAEVVEKLSTLEDKYFSMEKKFETK